MFDCIPVQNCVDKTCVFEGFEDSVCFCQKKEQMLLILFQKLGVLGVN